MYKIAKGLGRLALSLTIACAFGYGFYGLVTYAWPLSHDRLGEARASLVADETEVLLNGAAKAYDESILPNGKVDKARLAEASRVLEVELDKLISQSGRYRLLDKSKLTRVYFLLGKVYQRQEKFDKAIDAYENTLRLDPDHLPAKYNLEMLQMQGGGGDEGGSSPKKGQQPHKI
ncbi:MAG: tetratricopeptide repeat protein [Cyanobacteria bacterium SZAS LIN-2]|nr:tetratricopeptide repeat protein [Cyanobacteria bacterium SZAS LIN-3]MBS1996307.1 tetratricopeptide repeat protein [Cyanobacteria bacterium SZAS LIN-2]MBS2010222.1 tetratricopeptide repeat protein [Cyanobacteria bacterium SZAS TMP-1]